MLLKVLMIFAAGISSQSFRDRNLDKDLYSKMFSTLITLKDADGFKPALVKLQKYFFENFFSSTKPLTSSLPSVVDELIMLAKSVSYDSQYQTYTYGLSTNGMTERILVSGAKGSSQGNGVISSVCHSEANNGPASGILTAYATLYPNNQYLTEVKTTSFDLVATEVNSQYILAFAESQKQQFQTGRSIVGTTEIHMIIIGQTFVRYNNFLMIAGVTADNSSLKCSTTTLFTSFVVSNKLSIQTSRSGFLSNNVTTKQSSSSNHQSYHFLDAANLKKLQSAAGLTLSEEGVAYSKGMLNEVNFAASK